MAYMSTAVVAAIVAVNFTGHADLQQVEWVAIVALAVLALGFGVLLSRRLRDADSSHLPAGACWRRWRRSGAHLRGVQRLSLPLLAAGAAFGVALVGIACTTFVNWCFRSRWAA